SRRDFLQNGAIAFLTVYGASSLSWGRIWETAAASAAAGVTDPIIVSVFLDGGNDGLNTLVPITGADYAAYVSKRPHIKLDPAACLPLGGAAANPDFAWHPSATGFQQLYDAGKMAVIPAVDYQPPDLSHFHSRAFWQAGDLVADPATGWLGRWVDQNRRADHPPQAPAGGLGRLVAGRLAEERHQPRGSRKQCRQHPVLDGQRVDRPAADGRLAGLARAAAGRQRRHGRGRQGGVRRRLGGEYAGRPSPA